MVDRRGIYSPGDIIMPTRYDDISPEEISSLVNRLFPDGVAPQGERYLINNKAKIYSKDEYIDWGLEFYRRSVFPEKPYRYTSLFAWDSIEKARCFRLTNGQPFHKIFAIETTNYHRGDMSLLNNDCTVLEFIHRLDLYWSGKTVNPEPVWEYVCAMPVTIGEHIPD